MTVESPCQACGACCSYSRNWPRFTTEDEAALDLIPEKFVNERLSGMRCDGDRCSALSGKIGVATACTIYAVRPEVCRTCMPGDPECTMARRRHGLQVVLVALVIRAVVVGVARVVDLKRRLIRRRLRIGKQTAANTCQPLKRGIQLHGNHLLAGDCRC